MQIIDCIPETKTREKLLTTEQIPCLKETKIQPAGEKDIQHSDPRTRIKDRVTRSYFQKKIAATKKKELHINRNPATMCGKQIYHHLPGN